MLLSKAPVVQAEMVEFWERLSLVLAQLGVGITMRLLAFRAKIFGELNTDTPGAERRMTVVELLADSEFLQYRFTQVAFLYDLSPRVAVLYDPSPHVALLY